MMNQTVSSFLAGLAFCGFAALAPQGSGQEVAVDSGSASTSPKVQPGDVNLEVSRVYTFVDKTGLGHQHAVEGRLASGQLRLGASESAGVLVFDMGSFDADTDAARRYLGLAGSTDASTRSKVTKNMKSADILSVSRFPTATFTVASATATGTTSPSGRPIFELQGDFELHGTSRSIRIPVEVEQGRGWLHVKGQFSILQSTYGITPYRAALGAVGVADKLVIHGDLWIAPTEMVALETIPEHK